MSADEKGFLIFISDNPGMFVTKAYKALHLSGYKGDKLKESLIEKDLIVQEETRGGRGGRLAKVLNLTEIGASFVKKLSPAGKGGDLHQHLQIMFKEQAELYGWKATIEERIPRSLESVDLGLKKDDMRVAIEISSTSKAAYEVQNIRKCLEAGYDYVISVCPDDKQRSLIKREAQKALTLREREQVRFYHSVQVKDFLQATHPGIVSEKGIDSKEIPKQKQLLGTKEASELLGISRSTLYEWIIQKKIPHIKVGRLVKFKREDLEDWLKEKTQKESKDFM
jgi:excisionase family DNA binding protein